MYQGPVGDVKSRCTLCCVAVRLQRRDWQLRCDGDCVATKESKQQQAHGSGKNQSWTRIHMCHSKTQLQNIYQLKLG